MKHILTWMKEHKKELLTFYITAVTIVAILMSIAVFNCSRIIEENGLQDYFYTSDLPAEEF